MSVLSSTTRLPLRRGRLAVALGLGGAILAGSLVGLSGSTAAVAQERPGKHMMQRGEMRHGGPQRHGWHGRRGFGRHMNLARIQARVKSMVDSVGATSEQGTKIHDIIAKTYTQLQKDRGNWREDRGKMFELLKQPKIDAAALAQLRDQRRARMEARSKAIDDAIVEIANVLTPEQRTQLVERMERRRGFGFGRRGFGQHGGGAQAGDQAKPAGDGQAPAADGQPDDDDGQ